MAKRAQSTRRAKRKESRGTNWWLIGGVVVVGLVALFALLSLTLQNQDSPQPTQEVAANQSLEAYCQENPDNCMVEGDDNAPVTIVEISDYGCSHCRNFNTQTAGLIRDLYVTPGQVKWIVLPFALGPQTAPATSAAMCAAEQGSFFEFHQRMYELYDEPDYLTTASFLQAGEDVGLDIADFNACLQDGRYDNAVQQNVAAATAANVNSTPSFFVNGTLLRGNQPLTAFQQQINSILGEAGAS